MSGVSVHRGIQNQIAWDRLRSMVQEQAVSIMRTAFSPIVSENGDLACSLFDHSGRMLVQSMTGPPGFSYTMAVGVPKVLARFAPGDLGPGDIVITNDPWLLTGHLHDITLIGPIFKDDELVGVGACTVHWADVGGRVFSAAASEVYEEGIQIPPLKLVHNGMMNSELLELLRSNIRIPDATFGDLDAQVAAVTAMQSRVPQLLEEFGYADLGGIGDYIIEITRERLEAVIADLPNGSFSETVYLDGIDEPLEIRVTITIANGKVKIDFAGTSGQVQRGINCVYNFTRAYATFAFKCIVFPELPNNHGTFSAIEVEAPEGSILNATYPAPVAARHVTAQFIPLAVFGALSKPLPDRVLAESGISGGAIVFDGRDSSGNAFVCTLLSAGGIGAGSSSDGPGALAFPTNWFNTPVEVVENTTPLLIRRRQLLRESGGKGRNRGGPGQRQEFEVTGAEPVTLSCMFDHTKFAPRGYFGGGDGEKVNVVLNGSEYPDPKSKVVLRPGDRIVIDTAGGGGFGSPSRTPEELDT